MNAWLRQRLKGNSVRVLHTHGLWMLTNVIPNRLAHRYRIPLMVSPRGTLSAWSMKSGSHLKKVFWPLLQRKALECATCFHATSEDEYNDIRRLGFQQPIAIIPNGVDLPSLTSNDVVRPPVVLFLGRIHPKKGVDILLNAWRGIQERFPEWSLRIVGPDNAGYLPQMQQLSEKLCLERVEFTGPMEGQDKWKAYREARLFILPTHSENFGLAVVEALSAGLPCIVSKGAPWQGLEVHNAGWWIDNDIGSVSSSLARAMETNAEILKEMGINGREWVRRQFNWSTIASQFSDTYEWMINKSDQPDCIFN